jgi:hypothetical protein
MLFANSTASRGGLVAEGQVRIAQRFNAGNSATKRRVPKGRLKLGGRTFPSAVPRLGLQRTLSVARLAAFARCQFQISNLKSQICNYCRLAVTLLFTLADTGEKENLPLITIPAQ